MKLSQLKPNPKNPRRISDEKLEMLRKSLGEFGDLSGIVYNRKTKHLVGGHQRLKVLPKDAEIEIDTNFKNPSPTGTVAQGTVLIDGEHYHYREVDWDVPKEKAANIAANKHGGEWDLPNLSEWLLELDHLNYDLSLTGFDQDELADLMAPVHKLDPQSDEDEVPEHVEPTTKLGDLYQCGSHRVLCGDSTSIDAVEKLMDGEKADMVFTDPPYRQSASGGGFLDEGRESRKKLKESTLNNFDPKGLFSILSILNIPTVYAYCSKNLIRDYIEYFEAEERHWNLLIMKKNNPIPQKNNTFLADIEYLFFSRTPNNAHFDNSLEFEFYHRCRTINVQPSKYGHPTEKQVEFFSPYLQISSPEAGSVLDLFGGSGSTLIACEKTNRKCFMMELDPHYCDVIIARWEKYTGKKAKLIKENT